MALPLFNDKGALPINIHRASLDEVLARFGGGSKQRQHLGEILRDIHTRTRGTGKLLRFVLFGSFVTAKDEPNDLDIILVMRDDFRPKDCDDETQSLFDHTQASYRWNASLFWVSPAGVILQTVDEFLAYWQVKRDKTHRGIVEVVS